MDRSCPWTVDMRASAEGTACPPIEALRVAGDPWRAPSTVEVLPEDTEGHCQPRHPVPLVRKAVLQCLRIPALSMAPWATAPLGPSPLATLTATSFPNASDSLPTAWLVNPGQRMMEHTPSFRTSSAHTSSACRSSLTSTLYSLWTEVSITHRCFPGSASGLMATKAVMNLFSLIGDRSSGGIINHEGEGEEGIGGATYPARDSVAWVERAFLAASWTGAMVGLPISEGLPTGAYTQMFDDAGLDSLGMDRRPAPRRWLRRTPQDRSDALEARNEALPEPSDAQGRALEGQAGRDHRVHLPIPVVIPGWACRSWCVRSDSLPFIIFICSPGPNHIDIGGGAPCVLHCLAWPPRRRCWSCR